MENIDSNEDLDDEFEDEDDLEEVIQIEFFPYAECDIKYQVNIENLLDPIGSVEFLYWGKRIDERQLSKFESKSLLKLLSNLSLPLTFTDQADFHKTVSILPVIESALVVNTFINKCKFQWSNSDEENYSEKLSQVLQLTEMISDLIDPDTSNLEMPTYM